MGTLLERELIKKDFEEKYPILIQMMNKELDKAKEIYDNQVQIKKEKGKIPIHKNMPAVTGGLKWAQELKQRISEPMGHYKRLEHPYVYLQLKLCTFIKGSLTISVYPYDMHCVLEYILQKLKYKVLVHNYVIDKRYQIQLED